MDTLSHGPLVFFQKIQTFRWHLFRQTVLDHTAPGGTFGTYAAAGFVRRNLQAAGFTVERRPGFAGKREMLAGFRPTGR